MSIYLEMFFNCSINLVLLFKSCLCEAISSFSSVSLALSSLFISSVIERIYVNGDTGAVNIKFKQPYN